MRKRKIKRDEVPKDYHKVSRPFSRVGLTSACGPKALMILAGLTFPEALATSSLQGGYRGRRGTRTAKAIKSLGLRLRPIPIPIACRHHRNQLRRIAPLLADTGYGKGKYLVESERRESSHRPIRHASAVVDGRLIDWTIRSGKRFRIRAIYRLRGDFDAAKVKAGRFVSFIASFIPARQQPHARTPLSNFRKFFASFHGLDRSLEIQFRHPNGRKKRSDTMVDWYPLKLHDQGRAASNSNVCSLLASIHDLLRSDFSGLTICLTDYHGARVHGNTRIKTLTGKQPRGLGPRRRIAECATGP